MRCVQLLVPLVTSPALSLSPLPLILFEYMAQSSWVLLTQSQGALSLSIMQSPGLHIRRVLDSVLSNLKPLWNCNFRAQCLFF